MNVRKPLWISLTVLATGLLCASSRAQLQAYDGFGNGPLGNLHGSTGGSGWAGPWLMAGDDVTTMQGPGLQWAGLASTPGAAVTPTAGGIWPNSAYQRALPALPPDSPMYVSFLLRWDEVWGMWGGLSFGTYPTEMTVGSPLGYYTYGFMLSEGLADVSHKPLLVGETTLVVVRLSKASPASAVTYRMYLDPVVGQQEPSFPDAMLSGGGAMPTMLTLDNGTGFTTDEIRVGTTWASVLPHEAWSDLGFAKPGSHGLPALTAQGLLTAGAPASLSLVHAPPLAPATLVFGLGELLLPFKGGVMVPDPAAYVLMVTEASGSASLGFKLPVGVPSGTQLVLQAWIPDAMASHGLCASNGLQGVTP